MAFFKDTYCQPCERFNTKEEWIKHLCSKRQLHREVNGYGPSYFPKTNLTMDERSILEKAFWQMIFGSEDDLPVHGFLKTYFLMVTDMKDYVTLDDKDYDADFSYNYRDNMIAQFKQDFNNETFSHQDQDKRDDGLRKRIKFWLNHVV